MLKALFDWLKGLLSGGTRVPPGASPFPAGQGPARLLIFRHAEKTGDKRDPKLSAAGYARAQKLASYIPKTFGRPDFLIAASTSAKSQRPYETIEPLAKSLGLPIYAEIDDEDFEDMVDLLGSDARFTGKYGVIAWRHANISDLIRDLGAPEGSFPGDWDDAVYDVIVEITYGRGAPQARQIKQPF